MKKITKITSSNIEEVINFLKGISTVTDINKEVLLNGLVLYNDNDVKGVISYEKFNKYALIRYFIFKRDVVNSYIEELFSCLLDEIKNKDITHTFSVILNNTIKDLFIKLGFLEIEKEKFFIDEEVVTSSKYKNSIILIYEIKKT